MPSAAKAPAASRKPRGRGHERHQEILQAAVRLFVEHGVESVSTRRIASEVGISQTALYVYFPTKDAMLEALCQQCFQTLVLRFRQELASGNGPGDQLQRLMRAYVRFGLEHPDEYRLSFMSTLSHPPQPLDFQQPVQEQEAGTQCFLMLADVVQEYLRARNASGNALALAQAIWAAGHGLVALLITKPDFPWVEHDTLLDTSVAMVMNGLTGVAENLSDH